MERRGDADSAGQPLGQCHRRVVDYQPGQGLPFDRTLEQDGWSPTSPSTRTSRSRRTPNPLRRAAGPRHRRRVFQDPQTAWSVFGRRWHRPGASRGQAAADRLRPPGLQHVQVRGHDHRRRDRPPRCAAGLIGDCHIRYLDHCREWDLNKKAATRNQVTGRRTRSVAAAWPMDPAHCCRSEATTTPSRAATSGMANSAAATEPAQPDPQRRG